MLELIELKNTGDIIFFVYIRAAIVLVCWLFMVMSTIVDFWSGVTTAKALGEPLQSHGFRRTITKVGDYVKVMIFALMFDILGSLFSFYKLPFASILCAVSVMCIEGRSVVENSRRKKAHAADIPDIVKKVIKAATSKDAAEIIESIKKEC